MDNAQLINRTSGAVEWYTPAHIIEAARRCMGSIDLDPASCEKANENVKAARYFTMAGNGLAQQWMGNVWMNHPFGKDSNAAWINKLVAEYRAGNITSACCITFASTSERWFQPLFGFPQCYLSPRVNYIGADGKKVTGCTKGSVVTYLGSDGIAFYQAFVGMGRIVRPWEQA